MPRKSPGNDSGMITYRTLPGSSSQYQRVNLGECTAWVQTKFEFDLEVHHPDQTTETKPYIIHRRWQEGHLSQAEVAREIERLFHVPFAQSQVSRAIKLVDGCLQSVRADSLANRARQSPPVRASRKDPNVPGTCKRLKRKEVDNRDD